MRQAAVAGLPGCILASEISDFRSFTGSAGCTAIASGVIAMVVTGAKSRTVSYGSFVYVCGLITSALVLPNSSVAPSGAALAT
jgi:hypothetical protein